MALVDGLNHLLVQVSDLDRSEAFYRDVFELELVGRDLVNEEGPNSLLKTNSGHMILLVQVAHPVKPFRPNSIAIHHAFYLTMEQYNRAIERRRAAGHDVGDTRKAFRAEGQYSFDVFDPDGHRYQVQAVGPEASKIIKAGKGKVVCGNARDFAPGSVTHFKDAQFYLVRHDTGFLALSHWCTHMNGVLKWQQSYWSFFCPFHDATFNRKGESTSHKAGYPPLRHHPVQIDAAGTVIVDTDELLGRKAFSPDQVTPWPCMAAALAQEN